MIFFGLLIVSVLIIVAIEISEDDPMRQSAWHMIGLLAIAILAWSAKKLAIRARLNLPR